MTTKLARWVSTVAYAGIIFYLSSRTWGSVELFPHFDKVIHIFLYSGLGFLCVWALRTTTLRGRAMIFPLAASMAFIYGVSDEIHQMFVPGRTASIVDLIFDTAGAIVGAWAAMAIAKKIRKESPGLDI